ncbi:dual specificity protein phosphatase 22-B-like isoform 1-T2 [Pholidichthys leucotaenia]
MLSISHENITYLCISASDHSKQNLIQYFRDSIIFIHESRLKGEGCLVHCMAGVSRSVTLVVAYIMTVTGRGWVESLAAVRSARPCAGPNLGFLRQLEEFENTELMEMLKSWSTPLSPPDWIIAMCLSLGSLASLQRLQYIQNSAARVLMRVRKYEHITPILKSLHWLPVFIKFKYKVSLLTHQCIQGNATPPTHTHFKELLIH